MKLKKWQRVGLTWALWMFAFMNIVLPLVKKEEITFKQTIKGNAEIITEDLRLIERFIYTLTQAFQ